MYHRDGPDSTALRAQALDWKRSAKMGPFCVGLFGPPLFLAILGSLSQAAPQASRTLNPHWPVDIDFVSGQRVRIFSTVSPPSRSRCSRKTSAVNDNTAG